MLLLLCLEPGGASWTGEMMEGGCGRGRRHGSGWRGIRMNRGVAQIREMPSSAGSTSRENGDSS